MMKIIPNINPNLAVVFYWPTRVGPVDAHIAHDLIGWAVREFNMTDSLGNETKQKLTTVLPITAHESVTFGQWSGPDEENRGEWCGILDRSTGKVRTNQGEFASIEAFVSYGDEVCMECAEHREQSFEENSKSLDMYVQQHALGWHRIHHALHKRAAKALEAAA